MKLSRYFLALSILCTFSTQAQVQYLNKSNGCAVVSSARLANETDSDTTYVFKYQGACNKDGLAEGRGRAGWQIKGSNRSVVWDGQFKNGLFQPPNQPEFTGYIALRDSQFAVALGSLSNQPIAMMYALAIQANEETMLVCTAYLGVLIPDMVVIADEERANKLMFDAYQAYKQKCSGQFFQYDRTLERDVKVRLFSELARTQSLRDNLREIGPELRVETSFRVRDDKINYTNNDVAREAKSALRDRNAAQAKDNKRLELRQWFNQNGAELYVEPRNLVQNVFRYQGKTLMLPVELLEVLNPSLARVVGASNTRGYGNDNNALFMRGSVAQWSKGSRLVIVRVIGKGGANVPRQYDQDMPLVELLQELPCKHSRCVDWLGDGSSKLADESKP